MNKKMKKRRHTHTHYYPYITVRIQVQVQRITKMLKSLVIVIGGQIGVQFYDHVVCAYQNFMFVPDIDIAFKQYCGHVVTHIWSSLSLLVFL